MAIQAKLFDGTILQFPDGTDPSVIDKVAAQETASRSKAAAPVEEAKPAAKQEEESKSPFIKDGPVETFGRTLRQAGDVVPAIGKGIVELAEAGVHGLQDIGRAAQFSPEVQQKLKAKGITPLETKPGISSEDFTAAKDYLQQLKSEETQQAEREVAQTKGFLPTLGAYATHPSAILTGFGESAPAMVGGAGVARKVGQLGFGAITSAGIGEGSVGALMSAEQIRQSQEGAPLTPLQSAIATLSGVFTGALGVFGGKVANKLGVDDLDVLLATQKTGKVSNEAGSKLVAAAKGALSESVFEELPQSAQEQIMQNLATNRPWDEGVAESMASGLAIAIGPGAAAGAYGQHKANQALTQKQAQDERADQLSKEDAIREKAELAKLKKQGKLSPDNIIYEEKLNKILEGEPRVKSITTPAGESTDIPGQPGGAGTAEGTGAPDGSGVVGAGADVGPVEGGEEAQPTTLEQPAPEVKPEAQVFSTKGQAEAFRRKNQLGPTHTVTKTDAGFVVTPKETATPVEEVTPVEVFKPETQEVVTEEAPVQEAAPLELKTEEAAPVTAEAMTEVAPQAEEVIQEEEPVGVRTTEEMDAAEQKRIEKVYPVKTNESADVDEDVVASYDENKPEDLPKWNKLSKAEQNVYGVANKQGGVDAGFKALADFRTGTTGINPPTNVNASLYELNRKEASKEHKIDFPRWQDLSEDAQQAFLDSLPLKEGNKRTVFHEGTKIHDAFANTAQQMEQEGLAFRGKLPFEVEKVKLKGAEQEAKARSQEAAAKERAAEAEAVGKGVAIPEAIKDLLRIGNIEGVLDFIVAKSQGLKADKKGSGAFNLLQDLQKKASQKVFQTLAKTLNKFEYSSNVVTDEADPNIQRLREEGKLAEYDPKTDTFYFTLEGMDEATILHEVLHAATVKIINQFQTDPESLTGIQKEAVEHLNKLFDFVKNRLGRKYPNATENLYEFVAYAMTDFNFQNELAGLQVPRLSKYTAKDAVLGGLVKTAWGQFTQILSKMYNLVKAGPTAYKVYDEIYGPLAKEFASTKGSLDELYQDVTDEDLAFEERQLEDIEEEKVPAKFMAANKLLSIGKGFEGNVLLEVSEVMNRILAAPEAGVEVEPLAAKKARKKAEDTAYASAEAAFNKEVEALNKKRNDQLNGPTKAEKFKAVWNDKLGGYRKLVKNFQNVAEPLKRWHNRLAIAGKIIRDESRKFNNVYEQLVGAPAQAQALYGKFVKPLEDKLLNQLSQLNTAMGTDAVTTLNKLQMFVTALHEPERRRLLFIKNVPLRDDVKISINGIQDTPNNWREYIFTALNNLRDNQYGTAKEQAVKLRKILDSIVFTNTGNLESIDANERKGKLNRKNIDFLKSKNKDVYDENSSKYVVEAAYDPQRISQFLSVLNNDPNRDLIRETLATVREIENATIELNKLGNYWSIPVDNRVAFYGFKNYVPFKGKPEKAEEGNTQIYQPDSEQLSRDLQYYQPSFAGGRQNVADNPIAQVVTDAKKSAFLAANNKVTQALANAVSQGYIETTNNKKAPTKVISFDERYKGLTSEEIRAKNTVFHYKPDGTIEVYALKNQGILESLRQPYKLWGEKAKTFFRGAGALTRFIGQGFTRFNPFFAPWNAFRDTLTNLYNLNVDAGLTVAGKTLGNTIWYGVFDTIMGGGMVTAARVMNMYNKGDVAGIERLAEKDAFAKHFLEYMNAGGVVTYLQGVSNVNELRSMEKVMERGSVALSYDQIKEIATLPFDMWFNGFENTARIAAYAAIKDGLLAQGVSEQEAIKEAAIATKELANFEQTGKYGSEMGSLYMFARAQATGAVRAIDSLSYIAIPAEKAALDLPKNVQDDPASMARFKEEYNRRRIYSSVTAAALFGLGYMSFMMALSGSGDDDQGENIVEKDDMSRWTRAMRFTIPGTDYMFQLPWGFGKGAFSAWGAQVAAYNAGVQDLKDTLGNSITIGMDSFIPVPASRIPVSKDPKTTAYAITDTVAPTVTRPVFEWMINTNGLGMEIQNIQASRGGKTPDAFTGRANIPEYYKDTSEWLFKNSDGKVDVSPDILHFFASSYMNGISLLGQNLENASLLTAGDKEFNAKTDTIVLNSFIGTRSDWYSREFNRVEQKIKDTAQILEGFKTIDEYNEYVNRHPSHEGLVKEYQKDVNGSLKDLRTERKNILNNRSLDRKERDELLRQNKLTQQYVKAQFIAKYKMFDESLKTELDKD